VRHQHAHERLFSQRAGDPSMSGVKGKIMRSGRTLKKNPEDVSVKGNAVAEVSAEGGDKNAAKRLQRTRMVVNPE